MKLLTKKIEQQLLENARINRERINGEMNSLDFHPVVKFFTPDSSATYLLSEMDDEGRMFGLCDTGQGFPELGYVSLAEIKSVRGHYGLPIERDLYFQSKKPLSEYAEDARAKSRIDA